VLIFLLTAPLGVLCCYLAFLCWWRRQRRVAAVLALFAVLFLGISVAISGFVIFARNQLKNERLDFSSHSLHLGRALFRQPKEAEQIWKS